MKMITGLVHLSHEEKLRESELAWRKESFGETSCGFPVLKGCILFIYLFISCDHCLLSPHFIKYSFNSEEYHKWVCHPYSHLIGPVAKNKCILLLYIYYMYSLYLYPFLEYNINNLSNVYTRNLSSKWEYVHKISDISSVNTDFFF